MSAAFGQLVYTGHTTPYLGTQVRVLSTLDSLLPDQVLQRTEGFEPGADPVLNLGVSNEWHWIRFDLTNASQEEELFLRVNAIDISELNVLVYDRTGELMKRVETGLGKPFQQRGNGYKNYIVPLEIPQENQVEVLLQVRGGQQLMLPLQIITQDDLIQDQQVETTIFGMFAGVMIVMFFYNLFIFFSTRDKSYLLYVIYILIMGLTQLTLQGYGFKWLWPNNTGFSLMSINFFGVLSGIMVLVFARDFLKIKAHLPWADSIVIGFIVADLIALTFLFFGAYNTSYNIINAVAAFGAFFLMGVAIYLAFKGSRTAAFFVMAWSVFLVSVIFFVLKDSGLVPYNRLTTSSLMLGSSVEVVLISFALADRINVLKRESALAQKRELEAVIEKKRVVSEQNVVLEQRVTERTEELSAANAQLTRALEDLKMAQAQLVGAEKMASLGQLTAGIAHEINNPINFVAASVNPLKRDLEDMMTLLSGYEEIIRASGAEDQITRSQMLKQQVDFEFTLNEIHELLAGVDEGARRTAEIVQGLKNFSRLDEAESNVANIHDCLESTLVVLRNMMKDRVEVVRNYDESIEPIECYPGKLNQMFSNIIVNAVQAMEEVSEARLTIETRQTDSEVQIVFSDNGPGIPPEIRDRIFDPFFTTKEVGKGTGLGLSIVYSVINLHQGRMDLQSELGKGTTFTFTLPKQKA